MLNFFKNNNVNKILNISTHICVSLTIPFSYFVNELICIQKNYT